MRPRRGARLRAAALASLAVLAACGGSPPAPDSPTPLLTDAPSSGETPAATQPSAAASGAAGTGPCANDYLPVVPDSRHTYRLTSNTGVGSTYTDEVTDVRDGGFTILSTFADGSARRTDWSCTTRGLAALSSPGWPARRAASGSAAPPSTSRRSGSRA